LVGKWYDGRTELDFVIHGQSNIKTGYQLISLLHIKSHTVITYNSLQPRHSWCNIKTFWYVINNCKYDYDVCTVHVVCDPTKADLIAAEWRFI